MRVLPLVRCAHQRQSPQRPPQTTRTTVHPTLDALAPPALLAYSLHLFIHHSEALTHPAMFVTWLILPVVICLSQRLSHACASINHFTVKLRMAHYISYHLLDSLFIIG